MRLASPSVRISTVALAAALASIATYWALQVTAPRTAIAPAAASAESAGAADLTPAARLFGGAATAPTAPPPSNIQVVGVAAAGRRASVVLQIEGQPSRAYGIGDMLPGGGQVVAVRADAVVIDRGGTRIEVPAPTRPTIDLLSSGPRAAQWPGSSASGGAMPGMPAVPMPPGMPPPGMPPAMAPMPAPMPPPVVPPPNMLPGTGGFTPPSAPMPGAVPGMAGAPGMAGSGMSPGGSLRGAVPQGIPGQTPQ